MEAGGDDDAPAVILLLKDPNLSERGLILAAKLAARELGPVVIAHDGGLWDTDRISSDEEWMEFGRVVRDKVNRLG